MKRILSKFISLFLGCFLCFLLHNKAHLHPVLASALLGFTVSFIRLPSEFNTLGIQIAFFTGTFLGMSSEQLLSTPLHIVFISLIGSGIYFLFKPVLTGVGGKMGFAAFLSTSLWLFVRQWLWI